MLPYNGIRALHSYIAFHAGGAWTEEYFSEDLEGVCCQLGDEGLGEKVEVAGGSHHHISHVVMKFVNGVDVQFLVAKGLFQLLVGCLHCFDLVD